MKKPVRLNKSRTRHRKAHGSQASPGGTRQKVEHPYTTRIKLPSKRQADALEFIRQYRESQGYSPTLEEIGQGLGGIAKVTVYELTNALKRKGLLRVDELHQSRNLIPTDEHSDTLYHAGNAMAEFCNNLARASIEHDPLVREWAGRLRDRWHLAVNATRQPSSHRRPEPTIADLEPPDPYQPPEQPPESPRKS